MKRFIFLCSLFTVFLVKAQDSASIPTLHHGTEFIIKVVTAEDGLYSNSIVHEKKIGSKILISTSAPFLKRQIPDDEVRGQFGTIKSEKGTRTLLRIKSGIPEPLTFIIAVPHDETNYDVLDLDLYPNVLRNDFWSGRFEKILVGDLYKKQGQPQFEIMRDSTCIKNLGLDPEKADALIRKQLRLIRNTFDADEDLLLSGMEELEQRSPPAVSSGATIKASAPICISIPGHIRLIHIRKSISGQNVPISRITSFILRSKVPTGFA